MTIKLPMPKQTEPTTIPNAMAALRIRPQERPHEAELGDIYMDLNGRLYIFAIGGSNPDPEWKAVVFFEKWIGETNDN